MDLAIGLLPQLKAGFFQRRLFRQRYVCLFRKGHALDRPKLLLSDYKAAEHLVIVSAGTGHGKVDELIQKAGIDHLVRLSVPHFVSVATSSKARRWWRRCRSGWRSSWSSPLAWWCARTPSNCLTRPSACFGTPRCTASR